MIKNYNSNNTITITIVSDDLVIVNYNSIQIFLRWINMIFTFVNNLRINVLTLFLCTKTHIVSTKQKFSNTGF